VNIVSINADKAAVPTLREVTAQRADDAGQPGAPVADAAGEDTVVISAEAKRMSGELRSGLDELREKYLTLSEDLRRAREAGEGMAEMMKEKIRCLQIAMRIMSGHKVPAEDHHYLAEKDPELYGKAMAMRIERAEPKEYERLSEDEENEGGVEGGEPTRETPAEPVNAVGETAPGEGEDIGAE
jgi:hypothetical protein